MLHTLCLCVGMFGPSASEDLAPAPERAAYESARSQPGMGPDDHVRLALWCEAQGMHAERLKHLAIAILRDPAHITARGLLGYVRVGDRWQRADDLESRNKFDQRLSETLNEYDRKRAQAREKVDDHWKLALWCEENGLNDESRVHLTAITRLDPSRASAWRRLGYERFQGRWLTSAQVAEAKIEQAVQLRENARWMKILSNCAKDVKTKAGRAAAEAILADIDDPRAVPAAWRVFVQGSPEDQTRAVQVFGQIPNPAATRALALIALFSPSVGSRGAAMQTLARRDHRDAAGLLVSLLRDPEANRPNLKAYDYQFDLRLTGDEGFGSPGVLAVETRWFTSVRLYTVDEGLRRLFFSENALYANAPFSTTSMDSYERRVMIQRRRQWNDLVAIVGPLVAGAGQELLVFESKARPIRELNERIFQTLRLLTKRDAGKEPVDWQRWWTEELGYAYEPPPPAPESEVQDYGPKPVYFDWSHYSCFAKGTPVRTRSGLRPIEALRVGDQVLTQDTSTGALGYQPVVNIAHNPPADTLRIKTEDDVITTTGIHRFWKAGQGWVMARDLLRGDFVRTAGGLAQVHAIERGPTQAVYNLEVLGNHSFFVGKRDMLVHDKSQVDPVSRPFDAAPTLAELHR
jgi:hypothetical protein